MIDKKSLSCSYSTNTGSYAKVMQNFKRLTLCLENEGGHFEHLLPRTIRNNG